MFSPDYQTILIYYRHFGHSQIGDDLNIHDG